MKAVESQGKSSYLEHLPCFEKKGLTMLSQVAGMDDYDLAKILPTKYVAQKFYSIFKAAKVHTLAVL